MRHNIEIKAKVSDENRIIKESEKIAHSGPTTIDQEDTYYDCRNGRLKLRKFSDNRGELIYYERGNGPDPRSCNYLIVGTSEPDSLKEILSRAFTIRGVVEKRRILYVAGQTRIHLDNVQGLGEYVELEYVLSPGQEEAEGITHLEGLMKRLGISKDDLMEESYIDMVTGTGGTFRPPE